MKVKRLSVSTVLLMNHMRKKDDAAIIARINKQSSRTQRCPNCDAYPSNCTCLDGPSRTMEPIKGSSMNVPFGISAE